MTTMLEKAAAAAFYRENGRSVAFADVGVIERAHWFALARAALLAIREPDESAIRAASEAFHEEHAPADGASDESIAAGIRAYVDAILNEPPSAP